jgi:hypothetical protein
MECPIIIKHSILAINHLDKTINTNISEVQAKNVVFTPLDDVELLDWTPTNKFAKCWYCQDIQHSSILKLVIEKAINKSPHHLLSSKLFENDSNKQWNQFVGFVSSHTKANVVMSFHIHSFAVFHTNSMSNMIVTNAPVNEPIGCWNVVKKRDVEIEMILSVQCAVVGGIFYHCSLSAILRRKIGKPKGEIGDLNEFEYMYLSELKVPYF